MPPNTVAPTEWAWHVHHGQLIEALSEPIENRVAYIKSSKPAAEVPTRLRLLKKVKDQKELRRILAKHDHKALDELHAKECPDCPWDGHTIFSEKAK